MLLYEFFSHWSKLQNTVALFSTKAKSMVTCKAGKEVLWVFQFLAIFGFWLSTLLIDLCVDNKEIISLTENPEFYRKTRYIEIRYHWICEKVKLNKIKVFYILTKDMIANRLMKPLNLKLFKKLQFKIWINYSHYLLAPNWKCWNFMEMLKTWWKCSKLDRNVFIQQNLSKYLVSVM